MAEPPPQTWTVLKLLTWTKEYFEKNAVESPRLCAEMLLAHVLGCKRIELYTRFDYQPTAEQLTVYRELVKRAAQQEPVAYLVGDKEFYSLKFKVTPDVLIPRPETELLVSEAVSHLRSAGETPTAWDLCTGSGCVALAVAASAPKARLLATDISPQALAVAAHNADHLKLADRLRIRQADLLTLPDDCADWSPFDVITANPPYIGQGEPVGPTVRHEPALALMGGPDGLDCIRRIVADAPAQLKPGGILAMEFGYRQADTVRNLIVTQGCFEEPRILRDQQGIERAAIARRKA